MEVDRPITIAVLLFITLALIFYLVLPKYQAFEDVLAKVGQKEIEFQSKDAYFVEVTSVYKELMNYQDSLAKIESAIPEKFSLASLINFVYKKSLENSIIIQSVQVGKGATVGKSTNVKETTLNLSVVGSYDALKRFSASLEGSARMIEGQKFSFSVPIPTPLTPTPAQNYPISIQIKVYSY